MSPDIPREYARLPVIGTLLRLSGGARLADERGTLSPRDAASSLTAQGIAFVVLDTRRAPPDLTEYVQSQIALRRIAEQDGRIFYQVD